MIEEIFNKFNEINPEPKIELNYNNNFTLLIAVLLSAQTTDKSVNIATESIFDKYNTPQKMLLFGNKNLEDAIKRIGLYHTKAKNIIELCNILIEKHSGEVPDNFDDLIRLPGVGRKTADVVLNSAFDEPRIAVDCHIFRIVHRIGITSGKTADEVADNLLKVIPKKWHKHAHHWLVLHGRHVCKARKPDCNNCNISQWCLKNI
jgi:endonuclease-3